MKTASRARATALVLAAMLAAGPGCRRRQTAPAGPATGAAGAIAGRLVSGPGLPLGEAWIEVAAEDPAAQRAPRMSRVAADGTFRVADLQPGRYLLRARAEGHADARAVVTLVAGTSGQAVLRLARAVTLRGRVRDGRGSPVPGARVVAIASGAAAVPGPPREATTDADGRFAIDRLEAGSFRVLAEAPGFESAELPPVALPSAEVEVHLAGEAQVIAGRVLAGGAPADGARVLLAHGTETTAREALALADGTFMFAGVGPGLYALRATRGSLASPVAAGVTVEAGPARRPAKVDARDVRLELAPGAFVEGRVVDDAGAPVAGAGVRVEPTGGDLTSDQVTADGAGRFRAGPFAPGEYRLIPARAGYVPARSVTARLDAAAPASGQRLELVRGVMLTGRVVDDGGAAVAGATVRCLAPGIDDLVVLFDALPLAAEAAALPSGTGRALGATRSVRTDAAGRFEIDDLLPGRYRLEASRPAAIPMRTGELALAPGERRDAGTLALQQGISVGGRVVDEQGAAVAGAHVAVRRRTPASAAGRGPTADADVGLYAVTDGAGRFGLALAPGPYALVVTAPSLTDQAVPIDVAAQPPPDVEVKLARADGTLEGIARDEGGRPLARARVTAWPPGEAPGQPAADASPFSSTSTDAGGHFTLARVPRRPLLIEVRHPEYPVAVATVSPGALVMVTAPIPGGIAGEVRDQGAGAPLSRFRVEATGPDGRTETAARGKQGAFTLARLQPGRWRVIASAPGFVTAEREVEVPRSSALGEPSVRDLRLDLAPAR